MEERSENENSTLSGRRRPRDEDDDAEANITDENSAKKATVRLVGYAF